MGKTKVMVSGEGGEGMISRIEEEETEVVHVFCGFGEAFIECRGK